ncbi:MAG: hypothetical protein CTY20_06780 [Hyphomicrobium sp.]|nr:MAG: hypothetical protein CTY20_06780 [Hyphomicrobium sp.]
MILLLGGLACGILAGAAAQSGRLCTMGAIEDAIVARDHRAAKAWALAAAVALLGTQTLQWFGVLDLRESIFLAPQFDWLAALAGGILFGFGMALAGTCSFGLLVRSGRGDLRAMVVAAIIGIAAFAFTAGALQPVRSLVAGHFAIDLEAWGGASLETAITQTLGPGWSMAAAALIAIALALPALLDRRVRRRLRLLVAALGLGLAVIAGWTVNGISAQALLEPSRVESLSFVAPVGRLLLQIMSEPVQYASFGIASVGGVALGAFLVAAWKDELRWEAFDDPREMRRHMIGGVLMGIGGVLARGCTIGQGMSAASALAYSAPIVILGVIIGANTGLALLLEGRPFWRLGTDR